MSTELVDCIVDIGEKVGRVWKL